MRPIKLTVQAFGPFAGRVEMDFRAIDGAPLFGIYGPTGGGKTSILDAICYALFGESSGGDRSPDHLRSHFADPAEDTFVELVFAIGKQRYLIHRSPTQEIAKKRGTGLTERSHEAYLFDVTDLSLDEIVYPYNPGKLLAEKKVREVDERVEGLLGYKASQFRQVVVLPQGRFRELLTAQSRDRSEILRKLFDTAVYARLTLRLKDWRSAVRADLERADEAKKTILDGVGVGSIDSLAAAIKDKGAEIAIAAKKLSEREVEALKTDTALEQGKRLDDRFRELDTAAEAVNGFVARVAEIEQKAAILKSAEAALRVSPLAKNAAAAANRLREAVSDFDTKRGNAAEAAIRLEQAVRTFENSEAQEPERETLRRRLDDVERHRKTWNHLSDKRQDATEATQTNATAVNTFALAELAAKDGEDNLKNAQVKEERVVEAKARKATLEGDVERLAAMSKAREDLVATQTKIGETERALQTASSERDHARDAVLAALERREAAETAFLSSTAVHLASGLVPGEPCPVCGSAEHPFPATSGAETVTRDQVNAARTDHGDAEKRFNEKRDLVLDLARDQKTLRAWAVEITASMESYDVTANVQEDLIRAREDLDEATSLVETESAIRDERAGAEAALEAARRHLEAAREGKSETKDALTRLETELETALRDVPETLRDEGALAVAAERADAHLREAFSLHEKARTNLQTTSRDHHTKAALATVAETAVTEERAKADRERMAFEEALKRCGFESEEEFRGARRGEDEMAALRSGIEDFRRDRAAAEDRLSRSKTQVDGKERPDVTALGKARAEAKAAVEDARDAKSKLESEHKHLLDARRRYAEKAVEYDRLDKAYREAALLGDVADGRGPNVKRIPLVNYVLQTYFEDVLRHANMRFQRMSQGRFALLRKQSGTGGQKTGLDISVFDTETDQKRDAATLSGGESFLAALSLALGLSDVVQAESGGIRLDAIFIDEGFGHLDEEALDKALETLVELSGNARSVGIISHVEEVKRMVPVGFDVVRAARGSEIQIRSGG